ncbi:hypothetical protein P9D39_10920 [Heyndrickxia oleronia]|nr:hypothetical protein [Heyndrickxia oleronia]MEC1374807.1 hypothetical protein [Heyndrickxia oleronia]QQZ06759.1 hypothetical protein I5818_10310 [Heyndrickxia oleronia]
MDGFYSLFFLWSVWIYTTFILSRQNQLRFRIAFLSLLLLIVYPFSISLFSIPMQLSSIILLIICYFYFSKLKFWKKVYMFLAIFIIMIGYSGFSLLELYDPVWIFMDRKFLFGFVLFLLAQLLYPRSLPSQILCAFTGTIHGEIIYSLILKKWGFPYIIGDRSCLDICALVIFFLLSWFMINKMITSITLKNNVLKENKAKLLK